MSWRNGVHVNLPEAVDFCRSLQLADYHDWRVPTISELRSIYDPDLKVGGFHVKGNLQLSGWEWSETPGMDDGEGWLLNYRFNNGRPVSALLQLSSRYFRALCVRNSGE